MRTERHGPRGRQRAVRYCISSLPVDAEVLLALVRGHWGVENGLHRTLDVQFREDDCRLRRGHGPAVMGILRRAALNMVRTVQQNFSTDVSIGLLRDRIGRHFWILAAALPGARLCVYPVSSPKQFRCNRPESAEPMIGLRWHEVNPCHCRP